MHVPGTIAAYHYFVHCIKMQPDFSCGCDLTVPQKASRMHNSGAYFTKFPRGDPIPPNHGWFGWLVVLRINVDLAIFQPYLDLEAGDNLSLKIQVARPGIEPRSSCSASQELNHSAIAAPNHGWK